MLKIALIDDKEYGLEQIRALHRDEKYTLTYFETFREFREKQEYFDIVYLDYYLDKDGITGDTIASEVKQFCKELIGFSSVMECSKKLQEAGADGAIQKI